MSLHDIIDALPKAELHLHIEGTLEPELMMKLAKRNNVKLAFSSVEEIRAAYDFNNLQDFLDIYYAGMSVLVNTQDFFDLAWAYLEKMNEQNVRHVEVFFDPQGHTERGISFDTVLSGLTQAFDKARQEFDISSKLIMCFLRHLPEEQAFDTLADACRCKDYIFGVGLDSSEQGNPPSKFERVYLEARNQGFRAVAHAGEEGSADYVHQAIDLLKVERIDHGNRMLEDSALLQSVAKKQIPITLCPISNIRLQVISDMKQHPLIKFLDAGVLATLNSDDPAYFGGYINENYKSVADALDLNKGQIIQLAKNSFIGSFLNDREKQKALEEIDLIVQKID